MAAAHDGKPRGHAKLGIDEKRRVLERAVGEFALRGARRVDIGRRGSFVAHLPLSLDILLLNFRVDRFFGIDDQKADGFFPLSAPSPESLAMSLNGTREHGGSQAAYP